MLLNDFWFTVVGSQQVLPATPLHRQGHISWKSRLVLSFVQIPNSILWSVHTNNKNIIHYTPNQSKILFSWHQKSFKTKFVTIILTISLIQVKKWKLCCKSTHDNSVRTGGCKKCKLHPLTTKPVIIAEPRPISGNSLILISRRKSNRKPSMLRRWITNESPPDCLRTDSKS